MKYIICILTLSLTACGDKSNEPSGWRWTECYRGPIKVVEGFTKRDGVMTITAYEIEGDKVVSENQYTKVGLGCSHRPLTVGEFREMRQ